MVVALLMELMPFADDECAADDEDEVEVRSDLDREKGGLGETGSGLFLDSGGSENWSTSALLLTWYLFSLSRDFVGSSVTSAERHADVSLDELLIFCESGN
jgi:hypothetical protein